MFVKKIDTNPEGTDASDFQSERGAVGASGLRDGVLMLALEIFSPR